MTTEPGAFDEAYETWRPRLYRALVLATGDRDGSTEAVDAGFARARRAVATGGGAAPAPALAAARRHLVSGRRGYPGFRLPGEQPPADVAAVLDAVRSLDLDDRLALIASRHLGWDDATIGRALGMVPTEAGRRSREATARVQAAVGAGDPAVIDRALAAAAAATPVPLPRLEAVNRSARRRTVGKAAGVVALVLVVAGGVGLTAGALLADPPPTDIGAAGSLTASLADLEWLRAVAPMAETGELQAVGAGDHGYLALFVDHRSGTQAPQVFTSANGLDWEAVGELPVGAQGGWVSRVVYGDGRWLAVGSTTEGVRGGDRPLILSSDDGATWTPVEPPPPDEVVVADLTVTLGTSVVSATLADGSITIVESQWGDFEAVMRRLLPDDVSPDSGWGIGADGSIEVYGADGTVDTIDAAELGVDPGHLALMRGGRIVAHRTDDDGQTWETLPVPTTAPGSVGSVAVAGGEVIAAVGMDFGSVLHRVDGNRWRRVDLGDGGNVAAVAGFDGAVYAAGDDGAGTGAVWRTTGDGAWERLDVPAAEGFAFHALTASPHGLVAVGHAGAVGGPAVVDVDDLTVSISTSGVYTVTDAGGAVVAEAYHEDLTGADPVRITDPESGAVVVEIDRQDIDAAWQVVYREQERAAAEAQSTVAVVATVDGETWVRLPVGEDLPPGFSPAQHVVGPNGVLLGGWAEQSGPGPEGGGQQLWVGATG